jgi:hypothetical protein
MDSAVQDIGLVNNHRIRERKTACLDQLRENKSG